MELGDESEFYMALSVYGGVIFAGLLIAISLSGIVIMAKKKGKTAKAKAAVVATSTI